MKFIVTNILFQTCYKICTEKKTVGSIKYTTCHRTSTQAAHSDSTVGNPTHPTLNSYSPHILGVTDMSVKITRRLAGGMW